MAAAPPACLLGWQRKCPCRAVAACSRPPQARSPARDPRAQKSTMRPALQRGCRQHSLRVQRRPGRRRSAWYRPASDVVAQQRRPCLVTQAASGLAQGRAHRRSRCPLALATASATPPGQPTPSVRLRVVTHRRTGLKRAPATVGPWSAPAELFPRGVGLARPLVRLSVPAIPARCCLLHRRRSPGMTVLLRVPLRAVVRRRHLRGPPRPAGERSDAGQRGARPLGRWVQRAPRVWILRGRLSHLIAGGGGVALRAGGWSRSGIAAVVEGRAAHGSRCRRLRW